MASAQRDQSMNAPSSNSLKFRSKTGEPGGITSGVKTGTVCESFKSLTTAREAKHGFFSMPFDIYPYVPGAEENEFKSYPGFLLTLLTVVIFLGFSAYTIEQYATQTYQKSIATAALEEDRVVNTESTPTLFEAGMLIRFTGNGSSFLDPTIFRFSFSARAVASQDAAGKNARPNVPLNLTQCEFTTSQGNAGGAGICFDYNQTVAAMQGDYGYPIYRYIQFDILPCINGTVPGVVCKSADFIDRFVTAQLEAVFITAHDVWIDDNVRIGQEMKTRHLYSSSRYNFPPGITQKVDVFSQVRQLTIDSPLIAWAELQTSYEDISVGVNTANVLATRSSTSDSFLKMYLRLSPDIETSTLSCQQSFLDMLSQLGSISALLILVFGKPGELLNGWLFRRRQRAMEAAGLAGDDGDV